MLAPDAKHMHVDATAGKTYRMALLKNCNVASVSSSRKVLVHQAI